MNWFSRNAARAAAVSLFLGAAFAVPASAQRVSDIAPLPSTAPVTTPAEPASTTVSEPAGPRVRAELPRVEPVLAGASAATVKKDNMHTITISTIALVLLVVIIVLLVV